MSSAKRWIAGSKRGMGVREARQAAIAHPTVRGLRAR